jgi:hypothetical protein
VKVLLIDLVEKELGPIDIWPTHILCYLCVDAPNPRIIKKLSAFFFGNELPYGLAWRLYKACNPTVTQDAFETVYDLYSVWRKSWNTPQKCEYYNMRIGKYVYINGSFLNQLELARSEVTVMQFELEGTGCQKLIGVMLGKVRQIEV